MASLKLAEFAYGQIKRKLSKKQRNEIVRQAERLIQVASLDEIRKYDTRERRKIGGGMDRRRPARRLEKRGEKNPSAKKTTARRAARR